MSNVDEPRNIQEELIELVRELKSLRGDTSQSADDGRDAITEKIRTIGRAAAFFGGYDGMKRLHDACESMTGDTNEIGEVLNRKWDMIGGWLS